MLTIGGIFILRKKEPDTPRPYRAFGYPIIPVLYILLTSAICVDLLIYKPATAGLGLVIVLIGIPVYFLARRK
jgi:APA family basic amino acid/polyamine antiporter